MGSFSKEDVYRPRSPRSLPGCRRVRRQACVRQSPQLLLRWLGHHHFRLRLRHNHNSRTHSRRNFADPDRASRHHVLQLHRVNNLNLRHFCLRYSSELRLRPLHRNRDDHHLWHHLQDWLHCVFHCGHCSSCRPLDHLHCASGRSPSRCCPVICSKPQRCYAEYCYCCCDRQPQAVRCRHLRQPDSSYRECGCGPDHHHHQEHIWCIYHRCEHVHSLHCSCCRPRTAVKTTLPSRRFA